MTCNILLRAQQTAGSGPSNYHVQCWPNHGKGPRIIGLTSKSTSYIIHTSFIHIQSLQVEQALRPVYPTLGLPQLAAAQLHLAPQLILAESFLVSSAPNLAQRPLPPLQPPLHQQLHQLPALLLLLLLEQ